MESIAESNARIVLNIDAVSAAIATLGMPTKETVERLQAEIESIAKVFNSRLNCIVLPTTLPKR
ncbi:MAG: hypothetical protein LH613_08965 [Chamaesiphon sp.]|nr:hypothetical protein [Chamaesiphon sp.]